MNAGCNLELSYGMRNNVFMHIPQALAMGNITLQVSRSERGWGRGQGAGAAPAKHSQGFGTGVFADAA